MSIHLWSVVVVGIAAGLLAQCAVVLARALVTSRGQLADPFLVKVLAGMCAVLAGVVLAGAGLSPLAPSPVLLLSGTAAGALVVHILWLLRHRKPPAATGTRPLLTRPTPPREALTRTPSVPPRSGLSPRPLRYRPRSSDRFRKPVPLRCRNPKASKRC